MRSHACRDLQGAKARVSPFCTCLQALCTCGTPSTQWITYTRQTALALGCSRAAHSSRCLLRALQYATAPMDRSCRAPCSRLSRMPRALWEVSTRCSRHPALQPAVHAGPAAESLSMRNACKPNTIESLLRCRAWFTAFTVHILSDNSCFNSMTSAVQGWW